MGLESDISIGAKETASEAMKQIAGETANLGKKMGFLQSIPTSVASAMGLMENSTEQAADEQGDFSKKMNREGNSAKGLAGDLGRVETATKGLMTAFAPLLAVFAAVKVVQGFAGAIGEANEAYLLQEKAARGATEADREFANGLQRTLGVGDEFSLQLRRQAEGLGISKEMSMEAATAAIGLAKATGTETKEALKKVSQAMQGNVDAMAEGIPAMRDMTTEGEKWAAVNETVNRGLEMQKEEMEGLEGVQTRATNSWGDMMEVVGNLLAPMRAVISQGVAVFAEVMQNVLTPAVVIANQALEHMPEIFNYVNRAVVGGITAIEVVITNLPEVTSMAVAQIQLSWESLKEDAIHIFTNTLPALGKWFGENWTNLIRDAVNLSVTVFKNRLIQLKDLALATFQATLDVAEWFGDNLPDILWNAGVNVFNTLDVHWGQEVNKIFRAIWDSITGYWTGGTDDITSEMTANLATAQERAVETLANPPQSVTEHAKRFGEILSRDLTDGFVATTEPLPDLISRDLTEREKSLMSKVSEIAGDLGEEFSTKFNERMGMIGDEAFSDFSSKTEIAAQDAAGKLGGVGKGDSSLSASEGRLSTRGDSNDPVEKIARINETQVEWLRKIFEKENPDTTIETVEAVA